MTTPKKAAGTAPMATFALSRPVQTGLGWRTFFERLGSGTLPQSSRRQQGPARDPIRSFTGYTTGSDSR